MVFDNIRTFKLFQFYWIILQTSQLYTNQRFTSENKNKKDFVLDLLLDK